MSDQKVAERVRQEIASLFDVEIGAVKDEASIIDDLGGDSLDAYEICMKMEEAFGIQFDDDDIERAATVGDIVKLVEAAVAKK